MEDKIKLDYAKHLRWYSVVNYLVTLAEQIALFYYGYMTLFWVCLVLNILGIIVLANKIAKIEKEVSVSK